MLDISFLSLVLMTFVFFVLESENCRGKSDITDGDDADCTPITASFWLNGIFSPECSSSTVSEYLT
jgi:hypothetical protein